MLAMQDLLALCLWAFLSSPGILQVIFPYTRHVGSLWSTLHVIVPLDILSCWAHSWYSIYKYWFVYLENSLLAHSIFTTSTPLVNNNVLWTVPQNQALLMTF